MPNGIIYDGDKQIEQTSFRMCYECSAKIDYIEVDAVRQKTCAGCSSTIKDEKEEVQDFASFIITLIEKIDNDALISRHTRTKDVTEKAGGAAKISRGVAEPYDPVQAHVYSNQSELKFKNNEDALSKISPTLKKAYESITRLSNFEADISIDKNDDFIDVYVIFTHINAPK